MVEKHKQDDNCSVITGSALPLRQVSWVVSAEHLVPFDQAKALMLVEEDEREDEVPLPDKVIKIF